MCGWDPFEAAGDFLADIDPGPSLGNALAEIDPGPAIGGALAGLDDLVGDVVPGGWGSIAKIALTSVGVPAPIANGLVTVAEGVHRGMSPEQALLNGVKSGAITYGAGELQNLIGNIDAVGVDNVISDWEFAADNGSFADAGAYFSDNYVAPSLGGSFEGYGDAGGSMSYEDLVRSVGLSDVETASIPTDADFSRYIERYPDLSAAGIDTPEEAIRHYLDYGKNEGRDVSGGALPQDVPAQPNQAEAPLTTDLSGKVEEEAKEEERRDREKDDQSGRILEGIYPGALPGNLEGTYLRGIGMEANDPFANYNTYEQIAPIQMAQGGSPLQLAQMQQGIYGVDPAMYSVLQKRPPTNYFTYGSDTSSNMPTTFAGSQLMNKPAPNLPVIPTGRASASDWLYQGSGSNPLASAGAGLSSLPSGMMAEGGQAHGASDDGEHIPEFITGATGNYVKGRGTGQSDEIPAMLADGEWVADADIVSALGDGSSDAGAELLDAFRHVIRDHKRSASSDKIPPKASPLEYMKEALHRTGRLGGVTNGTKE
jgi:hypothetical protein